MKIAAIVAVSENGIIGKNAALPWAPIPEDMQRFKELTLGHAVIMGRKTWESLPVKPLSSRLNVVVSNNFSGCDFGTVIFKSLNEAIEATAKFRKIFLIGGEQIYREGLQYCDEVYLTRVHESVDGDARFDTPMFGWQCDFIGQTYDARASFYKFTRVK